VTTPDHLAAWLRVRERVPWPGVVPHPATPVRAVRDGFLRFAESTAARGPDRSGRLLAAQREVRAFAAPGADLTVGRLSGWNGILRGVPAPAFRPAAAHAKGGRERYGLEPGTERRFAACLAEAADPEIPVTARAARAYLDVNFFHPYDDANARLAALVLQFVLLRGGIELDEVAPIVTTIRRADDEHGAADLARMVHGMAAATRRRWDRSDLRAEVDLRLRDTHPAEGQRAHDAVEVEPAHPLVRVREAGLDGLLDPLRDEDAVDDHGQGEQRPQHVAGELDRPVLHQRADHHDDRAGDEERADGTPRVDDVADQ
jgi:hypothetical protein